MKLLEERIEKDGIVIGTDILKVDMFLNHQIDTVLLDEIGKEFYRLFKDKKVDKILTVEASGIAIAVAAARYFEVPVVFAKKSSHKYIDSDIYTVECYSYTHGSTYTMGVSKKYLPDNSDILIIDDFLAGGNASRALLNIAKQANCRVNGIGVVIEKGFQPGGKELRDAGYDLRSLAIVESMSEDGISFRHDEA